MKLVKTPYDNLSGISRFDLQFINSDPVLDKYHSYSSDLEGIKQAVLNKKSNYKYRNELVDILSKQHTDIDLGTIKESIQKLGEDNCFCVTSAHQPCLFGGPAYFIYKIASTIKLAKILSDEMPDRQFVPVFFLGSEDHDFEELNHLNLFNKKIEWNNPSAKGASGRWSTEGLEEVKKNILALFGYQPEKKLLLENLLDNAPGEQQYGRVMRNFIYSLFSDYGLVVIDPDDPDLKKLMIPVFEDELLNRNSGRILQTTIEKLEHDKVKVQAKGREINLFYLYENQRERIVFEDGVYKVLNTNISFDTSEISNELYRHPERFSPNVILRPVYQESILPNIAFIGGGGEIAYWTELKDVFSHFGVQYPPLIRRNSVTVVDSGVYKRLVKNGIDVEELQFPFETIEHNQLVRNSEVLDFSEMEKSVSEQFDKIRLFAEKYDTSSIGRLQADINLVNSKISQWEKQLNRKIKSSQESSLSQIRALYEKLFPNMNLQERSESCIWLISTFGIEIIDFLTDQLNPLEREYIFIVQS